MLFLVAERKTIFLLFNQRCIRTSGVIINTKLQTTASMAQPKNWKIGLFLAAAFIFITVTFYLYQVTQTANLQVDKEATYLYIPSGAVYATVMDSLKKNNIIQDELSFSFLAKLLKYQERVKAGRYRIEKNMGNLAAIRLLRAGLQEPVKVTFTNVRLKEELPGKICKNLEADSTTFAAMIDDPEFVKKWGFDTVSITTMFLPNTYEFYWNTSAEQVLERFHKEYKKFWTEERKQKAKAIGFSPVKVSVLASIIEAETNQNDEKRRMAGTYINRLTAEETNRRLQADPTLKFALKNFGIKRILNVHKEVNSPYNTYKYPGLPPGPINLPSVASIDAVLNYEKNDYLYFCAREDFSGHHTFAITYADHLANARLYQAALDKRNIR